MPLTISGLDAAGVPVNYTKTIHIDNQQPTVALSGPTDAPSTAGTQYVTATATSGSIRGRRDLLCGGRRTGSVVPERDRSSPGRRRRPAPGPVLR